MATETIEITLPGLTGFTLTAKLYADGSDTLVDTVTLTEATNRKCTYTGTTATGATGLHLVVALEGSTVRGEGYSILRDSASGVTVVGARIALGTVDANVVSIATDSISAAAVSAAAVTKIQSGLATSASIGTPINLGAGASISGMIQDDYAANASGFQILLSRIGGFAGSGLNTVLGFLRAIMRSDASVPSDVGGTFASSSASLEASANAIDGISANGITVSASSSVLDTIDDGGNITLRRGDRVSFSLTLGNVSGRTGEKLFFTIKRQNTNDTDDSNAIVQITETTGAVLVNGSATGVAAADASITVSNETTGVTVFVIQDSITTLFPVGSGWHYDVQMIRSDGKAVTMTYGSVSIVADTTRRKTI